MKNSILAGILMLMLAAAAGFLVFQTKTGKSQYSPAGNILSDIRIKASTIRVEEVSTPEKVSLGLSGRESMCENCGMLFIFGVADYRRFWMKDMKFDLDMLWIRGDQVVYVAKNISREKGTAEVVAPDVKADKVLELNSGTSDKLGIREGDKVSF